MRKRKWMKVGACALSAVLIMGLYAGPAFAEWVGTGAARAYILNGQVQTGWQQIDGKWYYLNEQGAPQIGWVKDGDKQYFNGLYAVAEGTLDDIFDVKIDGNPASNYDNVRITKRLGTFAQTSIPEFSQVVQETAVGVKLSESWHTLTLSGTGLSKLGIGINAMQGLGYANDSGSLDPITVTVEVQYCLENSCEWKGLATLTLSDAKRSAVMKYEEFGVERVAEPYKLRARRASGPTGDRYIGSITTRSSPTISTSPARPCSPFGPCPRNRCPAPSPK